MKVTRILSLTSRRNSIKQCINETSNRIKVLEKQDRANINAFSNHDKEIISIVFLFNIFHKFKDDFDELIEKQIKKMTGTHSNRLLTRIKRIINLQLGKNYKWPGNVRELEQCVRSVLLRQDYQGKHQTDKTTEQELINAIAKKNIKISSLISGYCKLLYDEFGTYEKVAKQTGLDRRTIKKYIMAKENTKKLMGD